MVVSRYSVPGSWGGHLSGAPTPFPVVVLVPSGGPSLCPGPESFSYNLPQLQWVFTRTPKQQSFPSPWTPGTVSSFSLTPLPWILLHWLRFHGILTCSNLCSDSQNYEKSSLYFLSLLSQPSPTPNTFPSGLHYSCDTPLVKVSNSLLDTQSN